MPRLPRFVRCARRRVNMFKRVVAAAAVSWALRLRRLSIYEQKRKSEMGTNTKKAQGERKEGGFSTSAIFRFCSATS